MTRCSEFNRRGEACRSPVVRDGKCYWHSMSPDEQVAWRTKGERTRNSRRLERAEAADSHPSINPGLSLAKIAETCVHGLGATFEHDHSPDWSARLSSAAILLYVFPRTLRTTEAEAEALIRRLLAGSAVEGLADTKPTEFYKRLRAEWVDARTRVDSLGVIFCDPLPSWAIAPWEMRSEVLKEMPSFEGWSTRPLNGPDGQPHRDYAMLIDPSGKETVVMRTDVPADLFIERQGEVLPPPELRNVA